MVEGERLAIEAVDSTLNPLPLPSRELLSLLPLWPSTRTMSPRTSARNHGRQTQYHRSKRDLPIVSSLTLRNLDGEVQSLIAVRCRAWRCGVKMRREPGLKGRRIWSEDRRVCRRMMVGESLVTAVRI
jgi:hypothetical protein